MTVLDLAKPDIAEAVATIAPVVPPEVVDAIADHVAPADRRAAALSLAEALQTAAEACAPSIRLKAAGITAVALDVQHDGAGANNG